MIKIANALQEAKKIAIFVHVSADGDALGSAFALKYNLERLNKIAHVYLNEQVSERIEFILEFASSDYKTCEISEDYDCLIALDCGDLKRLGIYSDFYANHDNTLNVDHHFTNSEFAKLNYVEGKAAATGELVLNLLETLGIDTDKATANLLYLAISSDTGCFAYSNATSKTYVAGARLLELGIDSAKINRYLFATNTQTELKLQAYVINNMKICHNGKLAVAIVEEAFLNEIGATYEHTEGLVDILRSVKGVEIACLIKQKDGKTKGSIRTNSYADATEIASHLGGGGHIRAAGFSCDLTVSEAEKLIIEITENI